MRAGVSGATVSRVYNHPDQVDEGTRELVLSCARDLGFVPDRNAALLRRRQSGLVLLAELPWQYEYDWAEQREYHALTGDIMRELMHRTARDWTHPDRLGGGIQSVQLLGMQDPVETRDLPNRMAFDGIIGFGMDTPAAAASLAALGKPFVACHHTENLEGFHRVSTDNRAGGALAAGYFRSRGCRKAVYAGDWFDRVGSHRRRLEGFRAAWGEAAVPVAACLGVDAGRAEGRRLAAEVKEGRVDCIACVNDLTALGIRQGLAECGVEAPRDCLVCGYDNLPLFREATGLPTVDAHLALVYRTALDMLADLLDETSAKEPRHIPVAPELMA